MCSQQANGGRNTGEEHGGGLTKEKGGSVGVSGGAEESRERRSKEFLKVSLEGKGNKGWKMEGGGGGGGKKEEKWERGEERGWGRLSQEQPLTMD